MSNEVTIVTCIKNRPKEMLENYLKALSEHEYKHDFILVDYGSDPENVEWERRLVEKHGGRFIEVTRDIETFNSGRALNIGIKHAKTPYIITTDGDVLIPEINVKTAVKLMKEKPRVIFCQRWDLNPDGSIQKLHGKSAHGTFMGFSTEWIFKVRGIDEKFTNWGNWDDDIAIRAGQDGLEEIWVSDVTKEYAKHLWHPTSNKSTLSQNMAYFNEKKPIIRNPDGWGEL